MRKSFKDLLLPFFILIPLIILLEYFILKPHLRYAFADVDWMFLMYFKQLSMKYYDPISHLINAWNEWGIYTYQIYYIGLIEKFFGMDYENFQIVTHVFKVITTLSIFPVIYLITKSRLAAFLTTLIYAVSFPSVGVMYTVVTSGLFVAIPFLSLFFIWYWYLIKKGRNNLWELIIWVALFILTMLLATERMYPLVLVIVLIEAYWWFRNRYSKTVLKYCLIRLSLFALLFIIILTLRPSIATPVSGNAVVTYQKLMQGNWQVLLSPIISLASLFTPREYWNMFGTPNISSFTAYLNFLISGPLIIFSLFTTFISIFVSSKPSKFIIKVLFATSVLSSLVYILASHQISLPESIRMHFDISNLVPAVIGVYVISLVIFLFMEWFEGGKKDNLLISMVGGMVISFIFIVTTWIAADWILVFTGVHRYLTIPAIGSSLFIACLIVIIFNKLIQGKVTKPFAYLVFLLLIPLIIFNASVTNAYFNYELNYAGTDAEGHTRMKNKLWSYLINLSNTEPSVFYFDESQDHANGYFDETTIMAGFGYWMRFRGDEVVDPKLAPILFRSNLICQEVRSMCLSKLKEYIVIKNGEKGILYGDIFYKAENFYAFRFINRDIVNIRSEVVNAIGLE